MPKNVLAQKNIIIIGVVVLIVLAVGGYFWFSSSSLPEGVAKVDLTLFNAEVRNFYNVKDSIDLSDSFMKGKNEPFFNELKNYYQDIPTKEPVGRTNPFVPYVAP